MDRLTQHFAQLVAELVVASLGGALIMMVFWPITILVSLIIEDSLRSLLGLSLWQMPILSIFPFFFVYLICSGIAWVVFRIFLYRWMKAVTYPPQPPSEP